IKVKNIRLPDYRMAEDGGRRTENGVIRIQRVSKNRLTVDCDCVQVRGSFPGFTRACVNSRAKHLPFEIEISSKQGKCEAACRLSQWVISCHTTLLSLYRPAILCGSVTRN